MFLLRGLRSFVDMVHQPGAEHFEEEFFTPLAVPPGFCGALVGPIAIFVAVTAVCVCPIGPPLAAATPESATAIAVAKIKYII